MGAAVETVLLRKLAKHLRQVGQLLAGAVAHQRSRQAAQNLCEHASVRTAVPAAGRSMQIVQVTSAGTAG